MLFVYLCLAAKCYYYTNEIVVGVFEVVRYWLVVLVLSVSIHAQCPIKHHL